MGKYDDIVSNIMSRPSAAQQTISPELYKARQTALGAVSSSQSAISSGKYDDIVKGIMERTSGTPKPSFGGGIMGSLGKGLICLLYTSPSPRDS